MGLGEDLEIDGTLSPRLLSGAGTAMDIYKAWRPRLSRVQVLGRSESPQTGGEMGVGLTFTAGVDSFYSLLKAERAKDRRASPASHLLFIHDFNLEPLDASEQAMVTARIQRIADESGKQAIFVSSNLRRRTASVAQWDMHAGAALASVALALSGLWKRCIIASSWYYGNLRPWGTHPLLDPLWSTEAVELVHDGCEARRSDKVREIGGSQLALDTMRVCWRPISGVYNCGRCEKCIATMVMLESEGVLDQARAFGRSLDPETVRSIRFERPVALTVLGDLLESMRARGANPELANALGFALTRSRQRLRLAWALDRGAAAGRRLRRELGGRVPGRRAA
jgi:hypothetical protein